MKDHVAPAVAFANRGYHVLVEKPMAVTEQDCRWDTEIIDNHKEYIIVMTRKITRACEEAGVMLVVCHVLRSPHPLLFIFFTTSPFLQSKVKI